MADFTPLLSKANGQTIHPSCDIKFIAKPKRPLSAYNLFYKFDRERLLAGTDLPATAADALRLSHEDKTKPKRMHRKTHGKITFTELSRSISSRWKKLPQSQKNVFLDQAAIEKKDYDEKMVRWRDLLAEKKKQEQESLKDKTTSHVSDHALDDPEQERFQQAVLGNTFIGEPVQLPRAASEADQVGEGNLEKEHALVSSEIRHFSSHTDKALENLQAIRERIDRKLASFLVLPNTTNISTSAVSPRVYANEQVRSLKESDETSWVRSSERGITRDSASLLSDRGILKSLDFIFLDADNGFGCLDPLDEQELEELFD